MMYRLPAVAGEWIDRSRPRAFEFEGRTFQGFAGDTISTALAAAGE
jgi:sarcosine oxidase subunit alpha